MKKRFALAEEHKIDNALYRLIKYLSFLDAAVFAIFCTALFLGVLAVLLGFLASNYIFLRNGTLVLVISTVIYFLLIKPILMIMYAISKILINTEKHTE